MTAARRVGVVLAAVWCAGCLTFLTVVLGGAAGWWTL